MRFRYHLKANSIHHTDRQFKDLPEIHKLTKLDGKQLPQMQTNNQFALFDLHPTIDTFLRII